MMFAAKIIFWLLLLDSVTCTIFVWFESAWYAKHFRLISRLFPPAKGWAAWYLILVLWIGWLTYIAA